MRSTAWLATVIDLRTIGAKLKKPFAYISAAIALIAVSPVWSASTDGNFAAKGPGRAPCSEFLRAKASDRPAYDQYLSYFMGFLTAANRYEAETFDLAPWHTASGLGMIVEHYCTSHTTDLLAVVAIRLTESLKPVRLAAASPLITVGSGEKTALVYQQILVRAQGELRRLGLYAGPNDGKYNPETKAAFEKFQALKKLDVNGLPDPATLWFLLNP